MYVDDAKEKVPASPCILLAWILVEDSTAAIPTEGKFAEVASDKDHCRILSISQDILYCSTKGHMKMPRRVSLEMVVHHLTCSTQILSLLNKLSNAIAPSQLMQLDTTLAEQELARRRAGAMLPSSIDQSASVVFFANENDSVPEYD